MRTLTCLSLLFWSLQTSAQTPITLTRADFPCPSSTACNLPDSILFTTVPVVGNTINTTNTGSTSIWKMNPLNGGTTSFQKFFPMSATPFIFQLAFLSCDYVQPLLGNNAIGALPVTDAYEYFNYAGTGSSRLEIKGFGAYVTIPGQTTPLPLPAIYSSPDIVYQFPLAYGNKDSSVSGYDITIPLGGTIGNITVKRTQKRVNEVDGWGSIETPAGVFDVLRVKSSINRIDSLITGLFPIGFPSSPVEYKWLGSGKKIPVFQILGTITGSNFTANNMSYWGQSQITGFNEPENGTDHSLFPNPALESSTISYTLHAPGDAAVSIVDMSGRIVAQFHFKHEQSGKHSQILPLNFLSPGLYIIKCLTGDKLISSRLVKM